MNFSHPFYRLPFNYDADRLREEVEKVDESHWSPHPQAFKGNDALILLSNGGTVNDLTFGTMEYTPALDQLPYLKQILASLNTVIGRTRLMRLAPGEKVGRHTDVSFYWRHRFRIHVPIVTDPRVKFYCEDVGVHMAPGECWTFDNWKFHEVHNDSDITRTHLVIDTVGSPEMWNMLEHQCWYPNKDVADAPADFAIQKVEYDPSESDAKFPVEKFNIIGCMPPADVDAIADDLSRDLNRERLNKEDCIRVDTSLTYLKRAWRSTWSLYGDNIDHYQKYIDILQEVANEINGITPKPTTLSNESFVGNVLSTQLSVTLREQIRLREQDGDMTRTAPISSITKNTKTSGFSVDSPREEDKKPAKTATKAAKKAAARTTIASASDGNTGAKEESAIKKGISKVKDAIVGEEVKNADGEVYPEAGSFFDRPVIILAAPRTGSTLLYETLANNRAFWSIDGESHGVIEKIEKLNPAKRNFSSNALAADDASDEIVRELRNNFKEKLKHPQLGTNTSDLEAVRFLEKTPKNALRVGFLDKVFPDALYIYLYRKPEANISSIIEGWKSGRYVTYRDLPEWKNDLPWSYLLPEGWQEVNGKDLGDIAAFQYMAANNKIMEDLATVDKDAVYCLDYDDFLENKAKHIEALCDFCDVPFGPKMKELAEKELPLSRFTLDAPEKDKWKKNEAEISPHISVTNEVYEKAKSFGA